MQQHRHAARCVVSLTTTNRSAVLLLLVATVLGSRTGSSTGFQPTATAVPQNGDGRLHTTVAAGRLGAVGPCLMAKMGCSRCQCVYVCMDVCVLACVAVQCLRCVYRMIHTRLVDQAYCCAGCTAAFVC